jgi:hypothetical protein
MKEQNSLSCVPGCGVQCAGGAEQFLKIKITCFLILQPCTSQEIKGKITWLVTTTLH